MSDEEIKEMAYWWTSENEPAFVIRKGGGQGVQLFLGDTTKEELDMTQEQYFFGMQKRMLFLPPEGVAGEKEEGPDIKEGGRIRRDRKVVVCVIEATHPQTYEKKAYITIDCIPVEKDINLLYDPLESI